MMDWLIDTFLWTGALIALILLARRPVARLFPTVEQPCRSFSAW